MTRDTNHPHPHQIGVTLLELLVALAITAAITVAVTATASSAVRSLDTSLRFDEELENRHVLQYLRTQISLAFPYSEEVRNLQAVVRFGGHPDELDFVAYSEGKHEQPGLYLIRLFKEEDALVMERRPFNKNNVATRRKLIENVSGLQFSYYGNDIDRGSVGEWVDAAALPYLVRIKIERTNHSRDMVLIAPIHMQHAPG